MIRLAIFDLDGTLLNTIDDLAQAGNHALGLRGFPTHSHDAYKFFVGDGVYKLIERMTPVQYQDDTNLLAQIKADFDDYYAAHSEDLTAPYEGVLELLRALKERGVTAAVLSNKPHEFTSALCAKIFGDLLAIAHGQRQGYPRKPDRVLIDEILSMTGVSADECIYTGDSGVDMLTAKNAGVFAIGALWGFRPREELEQCGADVLACSPMEILQFIR
ncbi:HAD family hydrolase [Oscillospiraceae bacterium PP1C4]